MGSISKRAGSALRKLFLAEVAAVCFLSFPVKAAVQDQSTAAVAKSEKKEKKGWNSVKSGKKKNYYYVNADGTRASGWIKVKGKNYYCDKKTGYRLTGIRKVSGHYYCFSDKGVLTTGWNKIDGKRYYFSKSKKYALPGLQKVGKYRYYFSKKGRAKTGWIKVGKDQYYFGEKGRAATGLTTIGDSDYYFTSKGIMKTGLVKIQDATYYFKKDGKMLKLGFTPGKRYCYKDGKILQTASLKKLLKTALGPVGHTLYVWGGGWSDVDNGDDYASGIDAITIGVPERWKEFFDSYGSGYNYRNTRFQTRNGLDCSGYVGWTLYNTFNTTSGNLGFVMLAENMASTYAGYGFGTYTPAGSISAYRQGDFRPGDIMSLASGHVYIVVGQCSDGSVVLLHSSPPGVMISGTSTPGGSSLSEANALSSKYMKKYFPEYYAKFSGKLSKGTDYLTRYSRMRWKITGNKLMTDPDGFADMNAAQVLKNLLGPA